MARDPGAITTADVIRLIDGPFALATCDGVTRFRPCVECQDVETCQLQAVMREARDASAQVLEERYSLVSLLTERIAEGITGWFGGSEAWDCPQSGVHPALRHIRPRIG